MMVFAIILLVVAAFGWFVAGKNSDGTRNWGSTIAWSFAPLLIAIFIFMYVKKKKKAISAKMRRIRMSKKRSSFKGISLRKKSLSNPSKKQMFLARMKAGRLKAARLRKKSA